MATHFFHSGMAGAPTNTNAAGSTLEIIRACLVTGFNLKSVVSATVASGVMTINYAAAHGYEDKVLIRLDGAAGGSIVRRVTTVAGSSSLTIPAPGFDDGAVSGALSTRVAPVDWDEAFTDTNVGVFRSKVVGPGSTRFFYRVVDASAGASGAAIRGYEDMTDASTGIGPFPTVAQVSNNGPTFLRSENSTARGWAVVADQKTCYIILGYGTSAAGRMFGDGLRYSSTDNFFAMLSGSQSSWEYLAGTPVHYSPRAPAGTGTAVTGNRSTPFGTSGARHTYPSSIDGGMLFSRPVLVSDSGVSAYRGEMRGLTHCSANPIPSSDFLTVLSVVQGVSGRVVVVRDGSTLTNAVAFPVDEDWP
jgi:hypothetical protein